MVSIRKVEMEIDWKVALNLKLLCSKLSQSTLKICAFKFISKEETLNTELYIYAEVFRRHVLLSAINFEMQ